MDKMVNKRVEFKEIFLLINLCLKYGMRVNEVDDSLDLNTFLIKIYKTDKEKEQI